MSLFLVHRSKPDLGWVLLGIAVDYGLHPVSCMRLPHSSIQCPSRACPSLGNGRNTNRTSGNTEHSRPLLGSCSLFGLPTLYGLTQVTSHPRVRTTGVSGIFSGGNAHSHGEVWAVGACLECRRCAALWTAHWPHPTPTPPCTPATLWSWIAVIPYFSMK